MQKIIFIGGGKGGLGRTLLTLAIIDYFKTLNKPTFLVDADILNPDALAISQKTTKSVSINLNEEYGWANLVDICAYNPERIILINTPTLSNKSIRAFSGILTEILDELNRSLTTLWLINRQLSSIDILRHYMQAMPSTIHVVRNLHFGDKGDFTNYQNSKLKIEIQDCGGKSLFFPNLEADVCDLIFDDCLDISATRKKLCTNKQGLLSNWQYDVKVMLDEAVRN